MKKTIEELRQSPYWIIDILPWQVPADSAGQYFAVEGYFLHGEQFEDIKQRHIHLVLKLNCYRDITLDDEETPNPSPVRVAQEMRKREVCILTGQSMILSEPDTTYLTLYQPDEALLELVRTLAAGEGLYIWKPGCPGMT